MLKESDIWVLGVLMLLALAAALLQATTPTATKLAPREIEIRNALNGYMVKAKTLQKDEACYIAKDTTQWQFEGVSRRLDHKRRVQLLTITTSKHRTLRLRFIVHQARGQTGATLWAIAACAVIDELRDA